MYSRDFCCRAIVGASIASLTSCGCKRATAWRTRSWSTHVFRKAQAPGKSNSLWRQFILAERVFIRSIHTIFIACRNSENQSTGRRPGFLCLPREETEEKAKGSSCPCSPGRTCGGLQRVAGGSLISHWAPPTRDSLAQEIRAWDTSGLRGSSWVRGEVCTAPELHYPQPLQQQTGKQKNNNN